MRTRIALVAIIPVALITVSTLTQAATAQPAPAAPTSSTRTSTSAVIAMPPHQLAAYHAPAGAPLLGRSSLLVDLSAAVLAPPQAPATIPAATTPPPAVAAPAPGPVDTVTPAQQAAWERVAMCEESGNWAAGGSRFSGGLGISRSNWAAYGGREFAPEGAMATEDQQIMVAERIQFSPPDQYGCHGW
jgi:Transglycosylase-like domain